MQSESCSRVTVNFKLIPLKKPHEFGGYLVEYGGGEVHVIKIEPM